MAEISQKDQLALHEFGMRYRASFAKENPVPEISRETVSNAVREEYEREQEAKRTPSVEPPLPLPERKPDEPDQGR